LFRVGPGAGSFWQLALLVWAKAKKKEESSSASLSYLSLWLFMIGTGGRGTAATIDAPVSRLLPMFGLLKEKTNKKTCVGRFLPSNNNNNNNNNLKKNKKEEKDK
jgi:hypothetical protein